MVQITPQHGKIVSFPQFTNLAMLICQIITEVLLSLTAFTNYLQKLLIQGLSIS